MKQADVGEDVSIKVNVKVTYNHYEMSLWVPIDATREDIVLQAKRVYERVR